MRFQRQAQRLRLKDKAKDAEKAFKAGVQTGIALMKAKLQTSTSKLTYEA